MLKSFAWARLVFFCIDEIPTMLLVACLQVFLIVVTGIVVDLELLELVPAHSWLTAEAA